MIKIKILSENRENGKFQGEAGLSVFVEAFENKFLMDTGISDLFLKNAKLLNVNVDDIEKIILSHGHNDHSTGVQFLKNKEVIMHPVGFKKRWSVGRREFSGFPISEQELKEKHEVCLTRNPIEFYDNCFYLGEISMSVKFEADGNFSSMLDDQYTQADYTEDDSGIAIKTNKGLFVMIGCGHRGVCNAIEHAKVVTGQNKIYGVFGGFHLRSLTKQKEKIDQTIEYFKQNNIKELYLGHCVSDKVIDYFEKNLEGVKINRLSSGSEFELELEPYSEK